ncbi:unnamed protein product [Linum trigynum]|uniref:Uncharacterized protein n=1 Tax=Linum trigynum TaxID=586398 RepID=A0AAV2F0M3_9ROSI
MNMEDDQRPWADICPYLLDSIYNRLSSHIDGTHFGDVCKNWHQVHSHIALSNPRPVLINHAKLSSSDVIQVREGKRLVLKRRRESQIPYELTALPTAQDSTIFVVYGDRYLCMFRRGNYDGFVQKTYDFSLGGKKGQTCLGVGYKDGRFFCLFEMGDMLIFSINENETRMLLAATKPLLPEQLQRWDSLSVEALVLAKKATSVNDRYHDHEVEEVMGFRLITHWERDREESFLLVAVEENVLMATDLLLEK